MKLVYLLTELDRVKQRLMQKARVKSQSDVNPCFAELPRRLSQELRPIAMLWASKEIEEIAV